MLKASVLSLLILSVCGCSSASKLAETKTKPVADNSGYKCERVIKVGSHMTKRRCSTKKQRDLEKEQARALMQDNQRTGSRAGREQ